MDFGGLTKAERIPLELREIYEKRGYSRYRMGKFEPYDMYAGNKQFLKSEGIITFTDAAGRLMALKPDVTMSIVKNIPEDGAPRKYYYNENVFRKEMRGGEYREINQIGVEFIGGDERYAEAEVITLAAYSLGVIGAEIALDISHMGLISGLLSEAGLDAASAPLALAAISRKDTDAIEALCAGGDAGLLKKAASLRCPVSEAESALAMFGCCSETERAISELAGLGRALSAVGADKNVFIDFSVVNDLDYYNGVVFRGFVRQTPRAVLAGGRYDNLCRRFGKSCGAVGFALYLGELDRCFYKKSDYDADVLLVTGGADAASVSRAVDSLIKLGWSVRAEVSAGSAGDIKTREVYELGAYGGVTRLGET